MKALDPGALLVVEDDEDGRQIISMMLAMRIPQFRLVLAESGEAALKAFAEELPAVIITDLNMPGMTGLQLAKEIGKIRDGVKFIILTAYSERAALDACRVEGVRVDHCVLKPIDYDKLLAAIRCCLSEIPPATDK